VVVVDEDVGGLDVRDRRKQAFHIPFQLWIKKARRAVVGRPVGIRGPMLIGDVLTVSFRDCLMLYVTFTPNWMPASSKRRFAILSVRPRAPAPAGKLVPCHRLGVAEQHHLGDASLFAIGDICSSLSFRRQ